QPVLDDEEQLLAAPVRKLRGEWRRARQQLCDDRARRTVGCPVARAAYTGEVPGAAAHESRVAKWRRFQTQRVGPDRATQRESEKPLKNRPMTATGGDIIEPGPSEQETARDRTKNKKSMSGEEPAEKSRDRLHRTSLRQNFGRRGCSNAGEPAPEQGDRGRHVGERAGRKHNQSGELLVLDCIKVMGM